MYNTTIAETTQIIEIDLVRHGRHYFYNRRVNGVTDISGQSIGAARAAEIYHTNANEDHQYASGPAGDFNPDGPNWSWTVKQIVTEAVPS
jgi:hypothetical protein